MICEEIVKKLQDEECKPKTTFLLHNNVSAQKRTLNQSKRLDSKANQIYRAKLLRLLKKNIHSDSEVKFYRHQNRNNKVYYP